MDSGGITKEDVKDLIQEIILRNDWDPESEVRYTPRSGTGDGFISKTVAVDIYNGSELHQLFIKYPSDAKSTDAQNFDKMYENEKYFYDTIYPAYAEFMEERHCEDAFKQIPKCYGTSDAKAIALENLKVKGFSLYDKSKTVNDVHLKLISRTLAKFHAVSFAFKDQKRKLHDKFVSNLQEYFDCASGESSWEKMLGIMLKDLLSKLDPVKDKHILDRINVEELLKIFSFPGRYSKSKEYSTLSQGDFYLNNMMFFYKDEDKKDPIDIMLIDWQLLRPASPVFDICYFLFPVASEETLNKLDTYLKIYYEELSSQIKQLGSDPDDVYPLAIFQEEWREYCKYGFIVSVMFIKALLASSEDALHSETVDFENLDQMEFFPNFKKEKEYLSRMKMLAEYMIKNNYL